VGVSDVLMRARGLSVRRRDRLVVDRVDLDLARGEVVAVVGPNGAGKSSLLAALAGDLPPATGSVELDGRDLASIPARELARMRSVLVQQPVLGHGFRVGEVIAMGREPWPATDDDDAIVLDAAERADVVHLIERPVAALSGGEAARVALARVLAQRTPVMLWDEPTAALDITHQVSVLETARASAAAGVGVLVVLHDLSLAAAYADRVVLLVEGRVRVVGAPDEVVRPDVLSEAYRTGLVVLPHPATGRPLVAPLPRS
jgi:iron complex transport system ATP-binding protein